MSEMPRNKNPYNDLVDKDSLNTLDKVCRLCGLPIGDRPTQARYCSMDCRNQAYFKVTYKPVLEQDCENCKKKFTPKTRKKTRYCSVRCIFDHKARIKRESIPERECQQCTQIFKPHVRQQIYCSATCRYKMAKMGYQAGFSVQDLTGMDVPGPLRQPWSEKEVEKPEATERRAEPRPPVNPEIPEGMTTPICELCGLAHVETEIDTLCIGCKKSEQAKVEEKAIEDAKKKWEGTPK